MSLVTKLDQSSTDVSLLKLGYFKIMPTTADGSISRCTVGSGVTGLKVEFVGSGYLCDSEGNEIQPYASSAYSFDVYFKSTGGFVQVSNKYSLLSLIVSGTRNTKLDIDELDCSSGITSLQANYGGTYGDIKSLNGIADGATVLIYGAGATGDLSSIATKKLSKVHFRYISGITGDLADVPADVAALTQELELLGCSKLTVTAAQLGKYVNATAITMTTNGVVYSDVADALYANGKVSGSVSIRDSNTTKTCTFTSSGWTAA